MGSWRDRGFDPRNFSHFLVDRCRVIVNSIADTSADRLFPLEIIVDAWTAALEAKVVGASTICMATLDRTLNQLSYANIGDCGLMVVRHMDVGKVGYMRDRKSRDTRSTDMRIAYLSQQQLRSFNLPYQLGFADGVKEWNGTFETPGDADMASIPVMPGDIILLATDGLFDNVDLGKMSYTLLHPLINHYER